MSTIRFKVSTWTASGIRVPATSGKVIATPTSLVIVDGDPDEIVPKTEVSATLVDGYAEIVLTPPSLTWCWNIKVLFGDKPILKGYYTFAETFTPLDFPKDLMEIDISTLTPTESAIPEWEAAVEVVQDLVDAASGFSSTAHQEALSAAASADLSDASADLALEYQTGAQTAQRLSEDARDSALNAQSLAEIARGLSEVAQSKAEIAQGIAEQAKTDSELAQVLAEEAESKAEIAQGLSEVAQSKAEDAKDDAELALSGVSSAIDSAVSSVVEYVDTKASEALDSAGDSANSAAAALLSEQHAAQSEQDAQAAKEAAELAEANTKAVAFTASSSTLTPGASATASITGAAPNFNLDVGIPAGRDAFVESPTPPADHTVLWVDTTTPSLPESGSPFELRGDGSPEGVKIAAVGTLYTDRIGSSGVWRWVKSSGSGNTGWTPQPAALTLTNLVANGDFAQGSLGWANNSTPTSLVSTNGGELVFLASASAGRFTQLVPHINSHIYYYGGWVKATSNQVRLDLATASYTYHSGSGSYEYLSLTWTATGTNTFAFGARDYRSSGWDNVYEKNLFAVDLTNTFGAGFEPTKVEMDAYFSKVSWFGGSQPLKPKISLGSPLELTGNGSPLGVVSAPVGSYYTDLLGTCGAWRWMKQSGTGNTGWVPTVCDTGSGWRIISSWDSAGAVTGATLPDGSAPLASNAGFIKWRRINNKTFMWVRGLRGLSTIDVVFNAPSGFAPSFSISRVPLMVNGGALVVQGKVASSGFAITVSATTTIDSIYGVMMEGLCDAPWPTTLPGTPG